MNEGNYRTLKAGIVLIGVAAAVSWVTAGSYAQEHKDHVGANPPQATSSGKPAEEGLDVIYAKQLPSVQESLARAIQHLEAGRHEEAVRELKQAQTSLEAVRLAIGKRVEPAIVNGRCPIMGSKIDPSKVSADLTRVYNGQTVAFCCAGCPSKWDQLDDAQKAAKLASVTTGTKKSTVQLKTRTTDTSKHAGMSGHEGSCQH